MEETEYEIMRSERRSFTCPNKLWKEIKKQTNECFSVSHYIRMAIIEKLKRENPGKDTYFDGLVE
ncbi:MAG: hypothetical protein ABIA04_08515 [Pseudomonadota bacterium]